MVIDLDVIRGEIAKLRKIVWGLIVALLVLGVGVVILGFHVLGRQQVTDRKAEILRRDLCAILKATPGKVPPQIAQARKDWATAGHPESCRPVAGVTPKPTPVRVFINGHPATIIVNPPASPSPSSKPSRSPRPQPKPNGKPTHKPKPRPTPSPSATCLHAIHRSVCIGNRGHDLHIPRADSHRP
jgi:outer membrane biosynthesis protein TonB